MVSVNRYFVDDALVLTVYMYVMSRVDGLQQTKYKAVRTLVNVFTRHVASNMKL